MLIPLPSAMGVIRSSIKRIHRAFQLASSQFDAENVSFDRVNNVSTAGYSSNWMYRDAVKMRLDGIQRYEPICEDALDKAFDLLQIKFGEYVFVDIGCGKGKALLIAARRGFKTVYGIDYAGDLCEIAINNMERAKVPSYNIQTIDAVNYSLPTDEKCIIFMYNPFVGDVMNKVLQKLKTLQNYDYLIYGNPLCHDQVVNQLECKLIATLSSSRRQQQYINLYTLH
jgi:SAM-dependent methyltransferase